MNRYEITGSGVGDKCAAPEIMAELAKQHGARRVRPAYHHGWSNQPKTIRFSAISDDDAESIGQLIREACYADYRAAYNTSLTPMLRAYGLHWSRS